MGTREWFSVAYRAAGATGRPRAIATCSRGDIHSRGLRATVTLRATAHGPTGDTGNAFEVNLLLPGWFFHVLDVQPTRDGGERHRAVKSRCMREGAHPPEAARAGKIPHHRGDSATPGRPHDAGETRPPPPNKGSRRPRDAPAGFASRPPPPPLPPHARTGGPRPAPLPAAAATAHLAVGARRIPRPQPPLKGVPRVVG